MVTTFVWVKILQGHDVTRIKDLWDDLDCIYEQPTARIKFFLKEDIHKITKKLAHAQVLSGQWKNGHCTLLCLCTVKNWNHVQYYKSQGKKDHYLPQSNGIGWLILKNNIEVFSWFFIFRLDFICWNIFNRAVSQIRSIQPDLIK